MNHFIWHPATGSRVKGRDWFVVRELRKVDDKGMRYEWHQTAKGNLHTFITHETAQKVADNLNERDGLYSPLSDDELMLWRDRLSSPINADRLPREVALNLIAEVQSYRGLN